MDVVSPPTPAPAFDQIHRVVIVTLGSRGGVDRQVVDLGRDLGAAGLAVEFYDLFEPEQVRSPIVRRMLAAAKGKPGGRFFAHFVADAVLYRRLKQSDRAAVLCLLYPLIGPWNYLNRYTKRFAYWYWMPDMIWAKRYVTTTFWRVFTRFARAGLRNCTLILVPTASAHIDLLAFLPKRDHAKIARLSATFAPSYWDGVAPRTVDQLDRRRFVFHPAGTKPSKNVWRCIRAFLEVSRPDDRFVLLAEPSSFAAEARRELGGAPDDRIMALSFVPDESMKWLYLNAAAVSVASVEEGVGLPILEAQHLGRVPVVSVCSALPQTARLAGAFVDPFSEASIGAAYRDALEGRELRPAYLPELNSDTVVADMRRLLHENVR